MAADKHTIRIVDKDGNQSEVTLPGFALDTTQEKLLKSIQALGKMNPKTAKAYEDLIEATKKTLTATDNASDQQKKDAKALQNTVQTVGDKQISALRQFRLNFADRVGKDMRDTFTAGGNILTAAIKTAVVGLTAGAGLLYKTFMDTSEAFRSLAQAGQGGGGATGTEAQDAVRSLVQLGMSASEAANLITSFGQASTILGKANFAKFVSGVANAGSFAAELGLTLEEAAEYAAEEIDIRQRALMGRVQLDGQQAQSVMEAIRQTQLLAGIMGKSMKDINQDKKEFVDNNANIASLLNRMPDQYREGFMKQITQFGGVSAQMGSAGKLLQNVVNAAMLAVPLQDSNLKQLASLGPSGIELINLAEDLNKVLYSTNQFTEEQQKAVIKRFNSIITTMNEEEAAILNTLFGSGNAAAEAFLNASVDVAKFGQSVLKSYDKTAAALDPMVTTAARVNNAISGLTGAFEGFKIQILGGLANPIAAFTKAFTDTRTLTEKEIDKRIDTINQNKKLSAEEKAAALKKLAEEKEQVQKALAARVKEITDNKDLTDEEKRLAIEGIYTQERGLTVIEAFRRGLTSIADTFIKVFFGGNGINSSAEQFSEILRTKLIPWVEETAISINKYLNELTGREGGDTFIGKLKLIAQDMIKGAIKLILAAAKAAIIELWQTPDIRNAIVAGIGLLFGASIVKSLAASAIAAGIAKIFAPIAVPAAAAAAGGGSAAATTGAAATATGLAAAGIRGRQGLQATGAALKSLAPGSGASLATRAAGLGVVGSGLMVGKDAFDIGASLYKGESVKGADVGGVLGGVVGGAIGLFGGPAGVAIGASLGNMAGEWIGGFFDDDEAESASAEVAEKTKEQLMQEQGLFAMALDPEHIKLVSSALSTLDKVSLANISKGLTEFNPAMSSLFTNIQNIRTSIVDKVNNRLEKLTNIITNLNAQGLKLPTTSQHLADLAERIVAMPVDSIQSLAKAMSSLTIALRDFTSLTTSNIFSRAFDAFTGKQDETESIIKVLNNFADKVDSEKLLKAAQATMAFNAGMAGYAAVPEQPSRTSPQTGAKDPADQVNTGMQVQHNNPYKKLEEIAGYLSKIEDRIGTNFDKKISAVITAVDK